MCVCMYSYMFIETFKKLYIVNINTMIPIYPYIDILTQRIYCGIYCFINKHGIIILVFFNNIVLIWPFSLIQWEW